MHCANDCLYRSNSRYIPCVLVLFVRSLRIGTIHWINNRNGMPSFRFVSKNHFNPFYFWQHFVATMNFIINKSNILQICSIITTLTYASDTALKFREAGGSGSTSNV